MNKSLIILNRLRKPARAFRVFFSYLSFRYNVFNMMVWIMDDVEPWAQVFSALCTSLTKMLKQSPATRYKMLLVIVMWNKWLDSFYRHSSISIIVNLIIIFIIHIIMFILEHLHNHTRKQRFWATLLLADKMLYHGRRWGESI